MIKSKIGLYALFLFLIIGMVQYYSPSVLASSVLTEDFEAPLNVGIHNFTAEWFTTQQYGSSPEWTISNTYKHNGSQGYFGYSTAGSVDYYHTVNSLYNETNNLITKIDIWFKITVPAGIDTETNDFIYECINGTDVIHIIFAHTESQGTKVQFKDATATTFTIYDTFVNAQWQKLEITYVSGNSFNYSLFDSSMSLLGGRDGSCRHSYDYQGFDRQIFEMDKGSLASLRFEIDDYSIEIGGSESTEYGDLSGYDWKGNIDTSVGVGYTSWNGRYIEDSRNVDVWATLHVVDLYVFARQYSDDSTLSNYNLKINDNIMGFPDYWVPYRDGYILRWYDLNDGGFPVSGEPIVAEFYHSEADVYGLYWDGIATVNHDIDDDSLVYYFMHDTYGLWDGTLNGEVYNGKEIMWRYWYIASSTGGHPGEGTLSDVVHVDQDSYIQNDSIEIWGTISVTSPQTRLVIVNDNTERYNFTLVTDRTFLEFIRAEWQGEYHISLQRNGVNVSYTSCNVTPNTLGYWLTSDPNPSDPGERVTFKFNYSYYSPPVAVVKYPCSDRWDYIHYWRYASPPYNEETFSHTFDSEGIYYMDLSTYIHNNVTDTYDFTSIWEYKQVVKDDYPCKINRQYESINLDDPNQYQLIWGSHDYLGGNVQVRFNGVEPHHITCSSEFELSYRPKYSGDYNVTLEVVSGGDRIILDWVEFTAYSTIGSTLEQSPYIIYIAFVFCICIGLMVGLVTESGLGFASGTLVPMMMLSVPGVFNMFPPLVMFICGLILIILFVLTIFGR